MKSLVSKIKPKAGFAHIVHLALTALLPALMFVFIRIDFPQIALGLVLLSKWRMLAVRPRHWWPNIRANAADIIVGLAFLTFMANTYTASWQLFWAVAYGGWLLVLKPRSDILGISLQAVVGQLCGLVALFLGWREAPLIGLVLGAGLIAYVAARHFFTSFDEPYTSLYAHTWGYFAAALTWVLGHWLLFYSVIAQPTLLLTVIGYGLAAIYYLEQHERLTVLLRRQFVFIMVAVVVAILAFSSWGDKTI